MQYDPRPFHEKEERREQSEDIAQNTRVSPAYRSDGTPAVLVKYGRSFGILPTDQAIKLATLIVNTVDEVKGMRKKQ